MADCPLVAGLRITDALAGKHLLVTGVTGFVGEALLERLLYDLPDTRVTVLVRPRGTTTAEERTRQLLTKSAFQRLRDRDGDEAVAALVGTRIHVLDGDLDHVPALPSDIDVVVHCAGEVSFDPPIHEGFATNLHGTLNLLAAIADAGATPHYVHVSTAYVAGRRQGHVTEGRLDHAVDWRAESVAATRVKDAVHDASREAGKLAEFLRDAERSHGAEGPTTVAAEAEKLRLDWVGKQLVDAGRERARTLGWTDCYTFTKAMAERAVEETAGHLPVTVCRPSIIESALTQPSPGWIEGFKMAEPLILAYGRGDLPDFPGVPDASIDIIPVDYVVNAILAACATTPPPGSPSYFTICSGARNPLTFRHLYDLVREYYSQHPLEQRDRGAVRPPTWDWPGAQRVDQLLRLGERAHKTADRVVTSLPRSSRTRDWARSLDRQGRRLDFLRRYFDLYRPYVEAELHFSDTATLALHDSLDPAEVERFGFDAATIDWDHYIAGVHVPAVTTPLRAFTGGRSAKRVPTVQELPRSDGSVVAVFDMDGTLLPSNVIESYLWLRLPELSGARRAREVADVARALPRWLLTERRDRGAFLRSVYRRYAGADYDELLRIVDEDVTDTVLGRLSAAAVRKVREHRAAGHRTVLITGAIAPLARPVAPLFDEIIAADLAVGADGRCTGFLVRPPLVGEGRGAWLKHRARQEGWDLAGSYAYADSASDLPLLRAVGHPVAVDPDIALSRVARRAKWPVESWHARPPVGPLLGSRDVRALESSRS
ncbi:MAG: alcohol-forming fatty acyl-CoA reductase [Frankiaceae bacterium]|nr:alcohol-forming fatty acyl-CoA reductase [Frankiaceae bacterium]